MNWFNSLTTFWKVIIIIAIIVVIYLIYKKFLKNAFQIKDIQPQAVTLQDGTTVILKTIADIPQKQREYLESLAGKIKTDIYGINITHNMSLYKSASTLSDVEIDYIAQYYDRILTNGVTLYEDMSNELVSCYVQDCSGWNLLVTKLEKTGNR